MSQEWSLTMEQYKTCPRCGQNKPISEWGRNKTKKDGLASECKKCHAAQVAEWRKENPEEQKRRSREQFAKSRERENARRKKRYYDNWELEREKARARYQITAETQRQSSRDWRKNNPEKLAIQNRSTRARRKNVYSEPYTKEQVLEKWGTDCHLCGEPIDLLAPRANREEGWERGLHLDHVVPLINGGDDTLQNVKPAHGLCNLKKGKLKPK
jgi:hypothetical protein